MGVSLLRSTEARERINISHYRNPRRRMILLSYLLVIIRTTPVVCVIMNGKEEDEEEENEDVSNGLLNGRQFECGNCGGDVGEGRKGKRRENPSRLIGTFIAVLSRVKWGLILVVKLS